MAAKAIEISDGDRERWKTLRSEAAERQQGLIADCPSDNPLDQLAWKAGTCPEPQYPFDNELRRLIEAARDARMTWREIAVALGEGEEPATVARVRSKQQWRNTTHEEHASGE